MIGGVVGGARDGGMFIRGEFGGYKISKDRSENKHLRQQKSKSLTEISALFVDAVDGVVVTVPTGDVIAVGAVNGVTMALVPAAAVVIDVDCVPDVSSTSNDLQQKINK